MSNKKKNWFNITEGLQGTLARLGINKNHVVAAALSQGARKKLETNYPAGSFDILTTVETDGRFLLKIHCTDRFIAQEIRLSARDLQKELCSTNGLAEDSLVITIR